MTGNSWPEGNPIHYCYGCQYCFGFLIDLEDDKSYEPNTDKTRSKEILENEERGDTVRDNI